MLSLSPFLYHDGTCCLAIVCLHMQLAMRIKSVSGGERCVERCDSQTDANNFNALFTLHVEHKIRKNETRYTHTGSDALCDAIVASILQVLTELLLTDICQ